MFRSFLVLTTILICPYIFGASHTFKKISKVQVNTNNNCIFLQLVGIDEADPSKPDNPWFTVPADNPSKGQILSMAMAAYAADLSVTVKTTGEVECDHASIGYLRLEK